jgi:hypothetical protein
MGKWVQATKASLGMPSPARGPDAGRPMSLAGRAGARLGSKVKVSGDDLDHDKGEP